jgi:TRAP-type transport system periplasmic protein
MARMRRKMRMQLALAVTATILAIGCSSGGPTRDKAGGPGEPVVLRMAGATDDPRLHPSVDYFVHRVEEVSGGEVRIELVNRWGDFAPDAEQQIVRDVAAGRFDLGSVGTGVFDTMGLVSFQALTAPMLIDSYALQNAVIQTGITDEMMRSLDGVGVVGLGVLPDGLRKPIGVASPILAPADWRGIAFGTMRSNGQAEAIRALGAAPVELNGTYLDTAADEGTVQGVALGFPLYNTTLHYSAPFVTWNVNLWPLMDVVIANPARLLTLTAEQRAWLEEAADDAAGHSAALAESEPRLIEIACATGARFAHASSEDLAALRDAFAPVYDELGTDPATRSFIAQIQALKRSTPAEPAAVIPADCTIGVPAATPLASRDAFVLSNNVWMRID